MLPEGVIYVASWINTKDARCFQVMEAPDREALEPWIAAWDDQVGFRRHACPNVSGVLGDGSVLGNYVRLSALKQDFIYVYQSKQLTSEATLGSIPGPL